MSVEEVMCDFLSVHKSRKNCKVLTRFKPATLKVFCIVYFQNSTWTLDTDQRCPVRFFSTYLKLEIKPCGLGSRIRDMEAEWMLRVITDLISW